MCLTAMFIFLLDYITDWTVLEWMLVVFFALFCIFGIILNEKEEKNKKSRKEDYKKRIVKEHKNTLIKTLWVNISRTSMKKRNTF